jgi:hypothetical protein
VVLPLSLRSSKRPACFPAGRNKHAERFPAALATDNLCQLPMSPEIGNVYDYPV